MNEFDAPSIGAWLLPGGLVGVFLGALAVVAATGRADVTNPETLASLRSVGIVLGLVVVVVGHLHWRTTGLVAGLYVAVAAGPLAGLALIDRLATGRDVTVPGGLRLGLAVAALVWFARACTAPDVDMTRRVRGEVAGAVATVGVVMVAWRALDAVASPPSLGVLFVLTVAWLWVAVFGVHHARARGLVLGPWLAWAAVAIGVRGLATASFLAGAPTWVFLADAARGAALCLVLVGLCAAISTYGRARRVDVHGAELAQRSEAADVEAERRASRHALRNSIGALEGAVATLERGRGRLTPEQEDAVYAILRNGLRGVRAAAGDPVEEVAPAPRRARRGLIHAEMGHDGRPVEAETPVVRP